jgi:hypothetical protein
MNSSAFSMGICGGMTILFPGSFAAFLFAASFSAAHLSCQQGSSFGLLRAPSGSIVVYCFSERRGGRGVGAKMFNAM